MATATHDVRLMRELEPVVERELDRHLGVAKDWFPHEYVPWGEGSDFDGPYAGQAWDPEQSRMDEVSRNSLELNLLTEDNLPSYHREIADVFGHDGAWGTWVGRWTAEEGRHAIAIRDYLVVTRSVDPVELERARMQHMTTGYTSTVDGGMLQSVAYVSFQELATRISHRNTGRHTGDPGCERLLARIAADENLHMLFYRNLLDAAFDVAPAETMRAVTDVVRDFAMPGATIANYTRRSVQIAMAGIYDLRIHHDEVLAPVLRAWNIWDRSGLGPDGDAAREELAMFMSGVDSAAARFEQKRAARQQRLAATA